MNSIEPPLRTEYFILSKIIFKMDTTRTYCVAKGTLLNVAAWMQGESGGEWIHIYVGLSPFPVPPLKLSQHC